MITSKEQYARWGHEAAAAKLRDDTKAFDEILARHLDHARHESRAEVWAADRAYLEAYGNGLKRSFAKLRRVA